MRVNKKQLGSFTINKTEGINNLIEKMNRIMYNLNIDLGDIVYYLEKEYDIFFIYKLKNEARE